MTAESRLCRACGETKPVAEFNRHARNKDGLSSLCRPCDRQRAREWRKSNRTPEDHRRRVADWKDKNPERYAALRFKWRTARYGLTPEDYAAMLEAQGGGCAACGSPDPNSSYGSFGIDHDHACCPTRKRSCGKCVRGLLCNGCNTALAHVGDDTERLRRLIAYLERRKVDA